MITFKKKNPTCYLFLGVLSNVEDSYLLVFRITLLVIIAGYKSQTCRFLDKFR